MYNEELKIGDIVKIVSSADFDLVPYEGQYGIIVDNNHNFWKFKVLVLIKNNRLCLYKKEELEKIA